MLTCYNSVVESLLMVFGVIGIVTVDLLYFQGREPPRGMSVDLLFFPGI